MRRSEIEIWASSNGVTLPASPYDTYHAIAALLEMFDKELAVQCEEAENIGYDSGYDNGYDVGYDDGYSQGIKDAKEELSAS